MESAKIKDQLKKFMRDRKFLVWYVKDSEGLPVESIVEHTLNYGDWDDVQKLIKIIGIKKQEEEKKKPETACCPRPGCDYVFPWNELEVTREFECPKCGGNYCLQCRCDYHNQKTCEEYRVENDIVCDLFETV